MRKKGFLLVSSALLIASLGYLFHHRSSLAPPQSQQIKSRSIKIAQFGDVFLYAPIYIAKDAGFFKNRNLDVSFVSTGGDDKTWAAVLSGSAVAGVADPTFIAISANQGLSGKVIASIVSKAPFWGITFKQDIAPFTDPKDLKTHSVATFPSPSTAFTLQTKMFKLGGLRPNIRQGSFGTLLTILKANQADIALEIEPNVTQALNQGANVLYGMDKIYGEFQTTGLTVPSHLINKNSSLYLDIVCSVSDAMAYIRSNHDASVALLSKRFPEIPTKVASDALRRMTISEVIPSNVRISKTAWDNAILLRKQVGDLDDGGEYSRFVDNSFADKCMRS
jgi:NitT/TauT family transport system substrate-binding protein